MDGWQSTGFPTEDLSLSPDIRQPCVAVTAPVMNSDVHDWLQTCLSRDKLHVKLTLTLRQKFDIFY